MRIRIPRISLASVLLASLLLSPAAAAEAPAVSAEAAVVADPATGRILFEKNGDRPMKAASTAKVLTALVVLEHASPEERVIVRPEWCGAEGSSMYLRAGESYTVRELLCGLLLVSGNDAAEALACHTAGSIETFVGWMNEKAAALGMNGSRFVDPSGLCAEGHQVTARDMALLACAGMKNELIRELVGTKSAEVAGTVLRNHNRLLWLYEGACGIKTGFTRAAGRTLLSCAEREGTAFVCVTLNAPDDWKDHAALLDWAFESFERADAAGQRWMLPVISGTAETAAVIPAACDWPLLPKGGDVRWQTELPRFVYAPVEAGEAVGRLRCAGPGGETLMDVPLVFEESVPLDGAQPLRFGEKLRWAWLFACRHSAAFPQTVFY